MSEPTNSTPNYKYNEQEILQEIADHIKSTYGQHYQGQENIQCFDAWIALGDSEKTFRDNILSYLWRYGKKNGKNRDDLLKAAHYIMMMLHVDFYRNDPTSVAQMENKDHNGFCPNV
jgi:Protein of unknwon function (DUF3310)